MSDGRYKAYPEYRGSDEEWLPAFPAHWEISRTKAIFSLTSRLVGRDSGKYQLLSLTLRGVIQRDVAEGGKFPAEFNTYQVVEPNELIFCLFDIDETPRTIGISPHFGMITGAYNVYRCLPRCDPKYACYYFLHIDSFKGLRPFYTGLRKVVRADTFSNIKIPAPPLTEQTQIAAFLDHETAKIDQLIEKQQALISLLKEKRQAVISHAVTKGLNPHAPLKDSGIEWLGQVPTHWVNKAKLHSLAESNRGSFVNGPFGSDLLADELKTEGVPVIYIRDIKRTGYRRKSEVCVTEKKAKQLEVCAVHPGDLIISKVGDPPGDTCVYPDGEPQAIITQDVIRIRVDKNKVVPSFLALLLNSNFGQVAIDNISVESTRKRVSLGDFKDIRFILPPIVEQTEIFNAVSTTCTKIDALIDRGDITITLLQERRTALISAAVTGKIDVRHWQPRDSAAGCAN